MPGPWLTRTDPELAYNNLETMASFTEKRENAHVRNGGMNDRKVGFVRAVFLEKWKWLNINDTILS